MIKKNRTAVWVSLLITLAVLISSVAATGSQQTQGDQQQQQTAQQQAGGDIGSGNQGAFIPSAIDTTNIHAHNINRSQLGWLRGEVVRRAISLEAHNTTGGTIGNPNIRTYVFFKLNKKDVRDWNNDNLRIMWRPVNGQTWQECSSFAVGGNQSSQTGGTQQNGQQQTTAQQSGSQNNQSGQMRLACITTQYNAYYALVRTEGTQTRSVQQTASQ